MPTPVAEYQRTHYRPDCDYVDGEVRERNLGEWVHSWLQAQLCACLSEQENSTGLLAAIGQRIQVKADRFRVADIVMVRGNPGEQVLTRPPFLCVEILARQDSLSSIRDRIDDYLFFGVENIWIADPQTKRAYWVDATRTHEAADAVLQTQHPNVKVDFKELWTN